jgi:hypothetical protein
MKTRLIAIAFGILISATAFAQRGGRSPEDRAEKMTTHLTEKLSLSEEQATEVKALFLNSMKEGREKAEQASNREERIALRKEQQRTMEEELKSLLSEEQFKDYLALKEDMHERRGHRRGRDRKEG